MDLQPSRLFEPWLTSMASKVQNRAVLETVDPLGSGLLVGTLVLVQDRAVFSSWWSKVGLVRAFARFHDDC